MNRMGMTLGLMWAVNMVMGAYFFGSALTIGILAVALL